jgi:hypothetical protein
MAGPDPEPYIFVTKIFIIFNIKETLNEDKRVKIEYF